MSLGELPAAVLDVVVQSAGEEHGWRLEVASAGLRATSMECAAVRLGKCRWTGGTRGTAEFAPSWRHVAVALRRGPYYVLYSGSNGHGLRLLYPQGDDTRRYASFVPRRQADKFAIEPTGDGEGVIHDHPSGRYTVTSRHHGFLSYQIYNNHAVLSTMPTRIAQIAEAWLLHLGSHASHLPFRRCRMLDGRRIRRVLKVRTRDGELHQVTSWLLSPATLADGEIFEWRV